MKRIFGALFWVVLFAATLGFILKWWMQGHRKPVAESDEQLSVIMPKPNPKKQPVAVEKAIEAVVEPVATKAEPALADPEPTVAAAFNAESDESDEEDEANEEDEVTSSAEKNGSHPSVASHAGSQKRNPKRKR